MMVQAPSNNQHESFFRIIAGRSALENPLSRLFSACFSHSPEFAKITLTTIWQKTGLSGSAQQLGGGRIDLILVPPSASESQLNRSYKPIHLESKVGSPLRKDQLQKYKESGTKILVAITKHWPEVSQEWLHRKQVKSMRWQDICRALRQAKCHGQKNRFICDNFRAYLEESEMAFREDITEKDLEDLRSLFLRIASPKTNDSKAPRAAFLTANDCIGLLQDVRRLTQEKLPIFSDKKSGSRLVHGTIMITIQMAHQSRTTGLALPFTKENGTNDGA